MILFSALAVVGTIVLTELIDRFYDSIIRWLGKIGEVAKKVVQGVLIGCKSFIDVTIDSIGKEISKNYSKVGDRWQITEVSRNVPASEIPDEIYERASETDDDMLELTEDIERQLLSNYQ